MTGVAVLLLDVADPEAGAIIRTAASRGYQIHAAAVPAEFAAYSGELKGLLAGRVLTDFTRPEQAVEEIVAHARLHGIGAVLTVNEYLTELAALVCTELGLPGNDPARAHTARDKAAMAHPLPRPECARRTPASSEAPSSCRPRSTRSASRA
jgi:hypothetical protein